MSSYHEPFQELQDEVRNLHRALASLREEVEAVDWYTQRAACCTDSALKRVIEHNRDEEIEHACLTLEWLRRSRPEWADALATYLFREGDLVSLEESEKDEKKKTREGGRSEPASVLGGAGAARGVGLGIGSLRNKMPKEGS